MQYTDKGMPLHMNPRPEEAMASKTALMEEIRGSMLWILLSVAAVAAALMYFAQTDASTGNTLPVDYGHNI